MRIFVCSFLLAACGASVRMAERPGGAATGDAVVIGADVTLRAAWGVEEAPTEVKQISARLVLLAQGPGDTQTIFEAGRWWRDQTTMVEPIEPSATPGALFETNADFAESAPGEGKVSLRVVRAGDTLLVESRAEKRPAWRVEGRLRLAPGAHVTPKGATP